jgi:quercetin dioxygenase-like cupin family protein
MSTGSYGSTSGTKEREARPLMDLLLVFSLADEIRSLRAEAEWTENEINSRTLAKDVDFRVVLCALHTDAVLDEQVGEARASVQLIEGSAQLTVDEEARPLEAGEIAVVDSGHPWALRATSDCAVLLTIAWPIEKAGV